MPETTEEPIPAIVVNASRIAHDLMRLDYTERTVELQQIQYVNPLLRTEVEKQLDIAQEERARKQAEFQREQDERVRIYLEEKRREEEEAAHEKRIKDYEDKHRRLRRERVYAEVGPRTIDLGE